MKPYKNKINRIRSFALSLIFIGFVIMYIGIFFRENEIIMTIFMLRATRNPRKHRRLCMDWYVIDKSSSSGLS